MLTIEQCQRARMARDPRFDGKFFVLVNTTGIFCRPICKVRAPLEHNVDYAYSAIEAMHKGFRPCLRCRPDSAPQSFAWQGVETTAKRAAKLLTEDVCSSVESIAKRLGVSPRYLHKIMQTHFKIAPKQFRIFHQVLLAKRLLQSSSMSVEQVAQGASFTSARQLQHHMKTTTGLTPTQIRKGLNATKHNSDKLIGSASGKANRKSNETAAPSKDKISLLLSYQGDYDWPLVRGFFERRLIANNEMISDNSLSKTLSIGNQHLRVNMQHQPSKHAFNVSFDSQFVGLTGQIISSVSKILDLQANPYVIFEALKHTGLSPKQINTGLRIPGICTRFEAGVRAILGQQVSVQAAITQVNRLQQGLCGDSDRFVTPQLIAQSDLAFLKMPAARKLALIEFASMMAENEDAGFEQWLAIKGIGPWTVNYVRLRASDDTDVWLNTDLIIKQQIAAFAQGGQALNDAQAAPWRSYLTLTLWNLS
ncbi:Ada metal-binding domain-containing protein [Glaciecola sp. SC05]|uniref:DNA-3-methyladenine glycosylase 2 family protein n=1 Tax=Glaciecola sp. SC05 TaxID=1987355 RepID=UPI0035278A45